jgi:hypothetical protein
MANDTDADLFPWILGTMDPGQRAYYHCRSRDINCLHSHASFEHSQNTKPKRHKCVASGTDGAAGSDTSPPQFNLTRMMRYLPALSGNAS